MWRAIIGDLAGSIYEYEQIKGIKAIASAETIALIIFYARKGFSKKDIINKLKINLEYKPFESFNSTCSQTIDNCLYALFTSNSFEESINKVISYGGDTDTNACIVGSIAEAMFGIDTDLINKARRKIPKDFCLILDRAYKSKQKAEDEWER